MSTELKPKRLDPFAIFKKTEFRGMPEEGSPDIVYNVQTLFPDIVEVKTLDLDEPNQDEATE